MFILGLTGSIGMGKSTTGRFFREAGVPVHDSDAVVHQLYEGEAMAPVEAAFPGVAVDGKIDRTKLAAKLVGTPEAIKRLEAIVHPLVRAATQRFLDKQAGQGARVVVLDIPLLFETGGERRVDAVVVVSAPAEVQRQRVLARPAMTAERLDTLLARQMSDTEKRARAHFVVDSSRSFDSARTQVHGILRAVAALPGGRIG
ncbi:MAG: dephospho-CoA kinase [Hyphomicrobiales bacterium]|jgi:dephospho-CoA kinase|nr:dephospho-CoA kinase [Hyphomicrobiales bacterium]